MQNELVKIMWVENDPEVIQTYPLEAEGFDLELVPFEYWDKAESVLKQDPDKWAAIILDAKCKLHEDSTDDAQTFLSNVTLSIQSICHGKRFIPWFVLSGQAEDDIKKIIPEVRKEWDGDWHKAYYDKNTDRELLFRRIRHMARRYMSASMKIRQMYKPVFDAIEKLQLHDDVDVYLTDLLSELHFPELDDKDYNDKLPKVRQIIEYIFRSMITHGMLPEQKRINLQWSNALLSGKECYDKNKEVVAKGDKILPTICADNLIHMIHTCGADVHSRNEKDENTKSTKEYMDMVGNSSNLLKSYALQLCDVILWYAHYSSLHDDEEINALKWEITKANNWK